MKKLTILSITLLFVLGNLHSRPKRSLPPISCDCCVWKKQIGTGNIFECTKSPLKTIEVQVCLLNRQEAKHMAEEAMNELNTAPPKNKMKVGCQ